MPTVFVDWLLDCPHFRSAHRQRQFWAGHYPAPALSSLFGWDDLNHCLDTNRITNDRLRLSTAQDYAQFNRRVFRPSRDAFGRATDHLLLHELQAALQDGVTAVLEAVNELSAPVQQTTQRLACALGVRSAANAYLSFGHTSGFGIHQDDHDVIVIQLDGRKTWQFFAAPGSCCKATADTLAAPSEHDRGQQLVVQAGDIMYVPKRTWHDVTAMNGRSLHLTISLVNPTWLDFVRWGVDGSSTRLAAVDIRPDAADGEAQLASCRATLATLCNEETLQRFLQVYHASHAVCPAKATFPTMHSAAIDDRFWRVAATAALALHDGKDDKDEKNDKDDHIAVSMLGRVYRLTPQEYALLQRLPCGAEAVGSALLSSAGQWSEIAPMLTRLMDLGLVGKRAASRACVAIGGGSYRDGRSGDNQRK